VSGCHSDQPVANRVRHIASAGSVVVVSGRWGSLRITGCADRGVSRGSLDQFRQCSSRMVFCSQSTPHVALFLRASARGLLGKVRPELVRPGRQPVRIRPCQAALLPCRESSVVLASCRCSSTLVHAVPAYPASDPRPVRHGLHIGFGLWRESLTGHAAFFVTGAYVAALVLKPPRPTCVFAPRGRAGPGPGEGTLLGNVFRLSNLLARDLSAVAPTWPWPSGVNRAQFQLGGPSPAGDNGTPTSPSRSLPVPDRCPSTTGVTCSWSRVPWRRCVR